MLEENNIPDRVPPELFSDTSLSKARPVVTRDSIPSYPSHQGQTITRGIVVSSPFIYPRKPDLMLDIYNRRISSLYGISSLEPSRVSQSLCRTSHQNVLRYLFCFFFMAFRYIFASESWSIVTLPRPFFFRIVHIASPVDCHILCARVM